MAEPGGVPSSAWLAEALGREGHPKPVVLRDRVRCDVCIVGGGYTGLWTAIEIKRREPTLDVVVLEAAWCGSGASGANAGYLMNLWPKYASLAAIAGVEEATWLARASSRAVDEIVAFCTEHAIDAEVRRDGWLWAATSPSQDDAWVETVRLVESLDGAPFVPLDARTVEQMVGTAVRGGIVDPTVATVQPALLVRGLRRVAESMGVRIHEHSAMRFLDETRRGVRMQVAGGGLVEADAAVLATNAWLVSNAVLRRYLVITASDNAMTARLPDQVLERVSPGGIACTDSTRQLNYWRTTSDGRVLFGKGGVGLGYRARGAQSMFGPVPRIGTLRRAFDRSLPVLAGRPFTTSWRAPVEYSLTSLPFFGRLPGRQRVYFGTGYSGDGVGPSRLGARILTSLALGLNDEWTSCALTRRPGGRLPPEPFRFLGGQMVKAALSRREELESVGRAPGPVVGALSRLDPTTFA